MSKAQADAEKLWWQTHHLQSPRLVEGQPHRQELANHISSLAPTAGSALEFGCSSGRNLATLHRVRPDLRLDGIDAADQSLSAGRDAYPMIRFTLGDERTLANLGDGTFDLVFTCSVLDHIPDPEWRAVYSDLVRVASVAVVMLEPILANGDYGWREASFEELGIAAPKFSYVHDYCTNDPKLRIVRLLPVEGVPEYADFGKLYVLMETRK